MKNNTLVNDAAISDGYSKLKTFKPGGQEYSADLIVQLLKQDFVILLQDINSKDIDDIIVNVADKLSLRSELELQAGFAAVKGHRENMSRYYMSVNKRGNYVCIPPHSEGRSFTNMQLASFFCYENSTDGGETILMNIDETRTSLWNTLREKVKRGKVNNRKLTLGELSRAKMQYQLSLPEDNLKDDDRILEEHKSDIVDLDIIDALAMPRKTYSKILERELYVFWSSMKSTNSNLRQEFIHLLKLWGIYVTPPEDYKKIHINKTDTNITRENKALYEKLFKRKIIRKLAPGELLIMNNQSWVHGVNNWTPNSGVREIGIAIA